MSVRTPITLVTGPLGSGKTTLLLQILEQSPLRLALVINEFGELGIDGKVIRGKNIQITELAGGCVCCSLMGEFEAAVQEILEQIKPEAIVVETTGVAEPEALLFDVAESLPETRIDGVIAVMDADAMIAFPDLGRTTRMQVEAADLILLNKVDLVSDNQLDDLQAILGKLSPRALVIRTRYCQIDTGLLFGLSRNQPLPKQHPVHHHEYESFTFRADRGLQRDCFERLINRLDPAIYRAKGLVRFAEGSFLFNYVNGRWDLEPMPSDETVLVFIGKAIQSKESEILDALKQR